jgi:hypothetical protein
MLPTRREFRENHFSDRSTLLKGLNEFITVPSVSVLNDTDETQYRVFGELWVWCKSAQLKTPNV